MVPRYNAAKLEADPAGAVVLFQDHEAVDRDNAALRVSIADAVALSTNNTSTINALHKRNVELEQELATVKAELGPAVSERAALQHELSLMVAKVEELETRVRQLRILHDSAERDR